VGVLENALRASAGIDLGLQAVNWDELQLAHYCGYLIWHRLAFCRLIGVLEKIGGDKSLLPMFTFGRVPEAGVERIARIEHPVMIDECGLRKV
jgi:hypothetical protein